MALRRKGVADTNGWAKYKKRGIVQDAAADFED